jgi:hypothetical protein
MDPTLETYTHTQTRTPRFNMFGIYYDTLVQWFLTYLDLEPPASPKLRWTSTSYIKIFGERLYISDFEVKENPLDQGSANFFDFHICSVLTDPHLI